MCDRAPGGAEGLAARQADVLVSELLGSFGDNELSPECLDGAQRFLAPGGVSVPAAYTSQLQPISASRAWSDVKARAPAARHPVPHAASPLCSSGNGAGLVLSIQPAAAHARPPLTAAVPLRPVCRCVRRPTDPCAEEGQCVVGP